MSSNSKTIERYTYSQQMSELLRRISRLEAILNGAPISDAKIATIRWNKAYGGIATLGGNGNGNGVLNVKDEDDNTAVVIDKDGVDVTNGKITIHNGNSETVIDSFGLVSTTNFVSDNQTLANYQLTGAGGGSTSWQDIPNTSQTFTLTREAKVMFMVTGSVSNDTASPAMGFAMDVDGVTLSSFVRNLVAGMHPLALQNVITLSAGSHTFKVKGYNNLGQICQYWNLSKTYVILGK